MKAQGRRSAVFWRAQGKRAMFQIIRSIAPRHSGAVFHLPSVFRPKEHSQKSLEKPPNSIRWSRWPVRDSPEKRHWSRWHSQIITIDLWKSRIIAHFRWKTRGDFCFQTYSETYVYLWSIFKLDQRVTIMIFKLPNLVNSWQNDY
jgi:hypothetical protein